MSFDPTSAVLAEDDQSVGSFDPSTAVPEGSEMRNLLDLTEEQKREYHGLLKNPKTTVDDVSAWTQRNGLGVPTSGTQEVLDWFRANPDAPLPSSIYNVPVKAKVPTVGGLNDDPDGYNPDGGDFNPNIPIENNPFEDAVQSSAKEVNSPLDVVENVIDTLSSPEWSLPTEVRTFLGGDSPAVAEGTPWRAMGLKPVFDAPANLADIGFKGLKATDEVLKAAAYGVDYLAEESGLSDALALDGGVKFRPGAIAYDMMNNAFAGGLHMPTGATRIGTIGKRAPTAAERIAYDAQDAAAAEAKLTGEAAAFKPQAEPTAADVFGDTPLKVKVTPLERGLRRDAAAFEKQKKAEPTAESLFEPKTAKPIEEVEASLEKEAATFAAKRDKENRAIDKEAQRLLGEKAARVGEENLTPDDVMAASETARVAVEEAGKKAEAHRVAVSSVVDKATEGWVNKPPIAVVNDVDELPEKVRRDVRNSANPDGVKAVIDEDGNIHIIASRLEDPSEATGITFHEALGHNGLTQKFGADLDQTLLDFYNNSTTFRAKTDTWLKENPGAYGGRPDTIARAADEVLAGLSEGGPLTATLMNKIKNKLKEYARRAGLKNVEYSDREIRTILGMAHDNVIYGSTWGKKGKTRFASRPLWHGTPVKKFDGRTPDDPWGVFKDEKMGSGEGAQHLGWGHYFAEDMSISDEYYRKRLRKGTSSKGQLFKVEPTVKDPVMINYSFPFHKQHPRVREVLERFGGPDHNPKTKSALQAEKASVSTRIDEVEAEIAHNYTELAKAEKARDEFAMQDIQRDIDDFTRELEELESEFKELNLFINDVDTPIGDKAYFSDLAGGAAGDIQAEKQGAMKSLSKELHSLGIHGIKFLDGGSRGVDPSDPVARYNHIFFSGKDVKIVDSLNIPKEKKILFKALEALEKDVKAAFKGELRTAFPSVKFQKTKKEVDGLLNGLAKLTRRDGRFPTYKELEEIIGPEFRTPEFKAVMEPILAKGRKLLDETGSRFSSAPRSLTPEKMETRADVEDLLKFLGEDNEKVSVPLEETLAKAEESIPTLREYLQGKNMTDNLAAQIKGAHFLLTDTVDELAELGAKAEKNGMSRADKALISQKLLIAQAIYGRFSRDSGEIGRALNILREVSASRTLGKELTKFSSSDGITALLADDEALTRFLNTLSAVKQTSGSPVASKFISLHHKALPEDYAKAIVFNSMLSSPVTWVKNAVGSPMNFAMDFVSDLVGTGVGKVASAKEQRSLTEMAARAYGPLAAFQNWDTYANVYKAFRTGQNTVSKPFYKHRNDVFNGWSQVVKTPSRVLAGVDELWANLFHVSNVHGLAVSEALKTGKTGAALKTEILNLTNNPTTSMLEEADKITNRQLFRQEPSDFVKGLGEMQQPRVADEMVIKFQQDPVTGKNVPFGKTVKKADSNLKRVGRFGLSVMVPFANTTENIVRTIVKNSGPLAVFNKELRADLMTPGPARHSALGRIAVSTAFMGYIAEKVAAGDITGAPAADYNKEKELSSSRPPMSIKVGDKWHSYAGFDPLAGQISAMATAVERSGSDGLGLDTAANFIAGTAQSLINSSYLESVKNTMQMGVEVSNAIKGGEGGQVALNNFIGGQVANIANPAFVRWYNQEFADPYTRDGSGDGSLADRTKGRIQAGIPGLSKDLPMRYDVFGRPVLNARQTREVEKDKTVLELARLSKAYGKGTLVGPVSRADLKKIENPTARQVQEYQRLSGTYIKDYVKGLIDDGSWASMSDTEKLKELDGIKDDMREAARKELFPEYGDVNE